MASSTLKINNIDMTDWIALGGYECSVQDIDYEAGRVASGKMKRNRVAVKRKIEVTFKQGLKQSQIAQIASAVKTDASDACTFTIQSYQDPTRASGYASGTFYVGDRTFPLYSKEKNLWGSFSMGLVEV